MVLTPYTAAAVTFDGGTAAVMDEWTTGEYVLDRGVILNLGEEHKGGLKVLRLSIGARSKAPVEGGVLVLDYTTPLEESLP